MRECDAWISIWSVLPKKRSVRLQYIVTLTHLNWPASTYSCGWTVNRYWRSARHIYTCPNSVHLHKCSSFHLLGQKWPQLWEAFNHTRWWVVRKLPLIFILITEIWKIKICICKIWLLEFNSVMLLIFILI